jgi:hypothetical protein
MGTGMPCPPATFLTTNHTHLRDYATAGKLEYTKRILFRKNRYKKGGKKF